MPNWNHLAVATACRVEWEHLCGRGKLVEESFVRLAVAEALQSMTTNAIEPEYSHADLPGSERLDFVGWEVPNTRLAFVGEVKWIRPSGSVRQWDREVAEDVFRVEKLADKMSTTTERVVVVLGRAKYLAEQLLSKKVQTRRSTPNVEILSHFLQVRVAGTGLPQAGHRYKVRSCDPDAKFFFKGVAKRIGGNKHLPISYRAALVGFHRTRQVNDGIVAMVWRVWKVRGRSTFDTTGW